MRKQTLRRSHQAAKRRRNFKVLKYIVGAISLVAILWSLSFVSKSPFFFVENISLEGSIFVSLSDIEPIVWRNLSGTYLGLFSKKNILLYPKGKIEREIIDQFPRIEDVVVRIKDIHTVSVQISERLPEALWCQGREENSTCYFLDKEGFIFVESPSFSSQVYTRFLEVLPNTEPLRSTFLPGKFPEILSFVKDVEGIGLFPSVVEIFENRDALLETEKGKILFSLDRNLNEVFGNLKSFWRENENFLFEFEYIDLRFGNKIFYKQI